MFLVRRTKERQTYAFSSWRQIMSWLYTIFIAGLLFSSGSEQITVPLNGPGSIDEAAFVQTQDLIEKFEQTYPLNADGRVTVSNVNGSIVIEAWDRNEVRVEATKIADSQESMDLLNIEVNAKPELLRIEAKYKQTDSWAQNDKYRNRKTEVEFRLMVPRRAVLGGIDSVNGTVTVSNFTNVTKISAVNGNVIATNLRGTAKLSTVNGQVFASFDRLDAGSSVNLDTVNGRVNLEVPSDINATIKADSLNGSITNDFGLPVRKGKYVGRDLHGQIGTGEVQLKLNSVNGSLQIGRKKDGKTPANVTNLLNMTKTDDDDEDANEVSEAEEIGAPVAVAAAVRHSTKAVEKSLKTVEKSLAKIEPQIEKMKLSEANDVKIKIDEQMVRNAGEMAGAQKQAMGSMRDAGFMSRSTTVDQRSNTFEMKGTPKVSIDARDCGVRVRGWDQPTVKYVLTEARTNRDVPLVLSESATENTVTLKIQADEKTRPTVFFDSDTHYRLEVFVPRKTDLRVVTQKELRVEGVSGKLDLSSEDDPVSIRDSDGSLKLSAGDGLVRVIGFRGDLDLKAGDAEVYLEGEFAKIDSCASDASITLTMPQNKDASIHTNTAIQSEGLNVVREDQRTWRLGNGGPKYNFEFSDGRLLIRNSTSIETN